MTTEITEHNNDMVEEENQMSSDDLIRAEDNSDYDILEEEKDLISKWSSLGQNKKINMERKSTVNSVQQKKRRSWIFENKMDGYTERG